jgi:hypothetical protein
VPAPDGSSALTLVHKGDRHVLMIVPLNGGPPRPIVVKEGPVPTPDKLWEWSADGRFIYYPAQDSLNQRMGIWRLPVTGGTARLIVPSTNMNRPWFRTHGNRIYFIQADQESDVWMTEVAEGR